MRTIKLLFYVMAWASIIGGVAYLGSLNYSTNQDMVSTIMYYILVLSLAGFITYLDDKNK